MKCFHLLRHAVMLSSTLFFYSCATLFNQPLQKINVTASKNINVIAIEKAVLIDSSASGNNVPVNFFVKRSAQPLLLQLQTDSLKKIIALKAQNSFAWWYNILGNYGIGMLVDKNNAKRYAYPKNNYISVKNGAVKIYRFAPLSSRTINLSLSFPFINAFCINDSSGKYNSAGVLGIEAGLEYFHRPNQYFSLHVGGGTDVFAEHFGYGSYENGNVLFVSCRNNHVQGRFDLGYGIALSKFGWQKNYSDSLISSTQRKTSVTAGLSFAGQYRIGKYFRCGVLYQPAIVNASRATLFNYQHYLSFNVIWKLKIKQGLL